MRAVHKLAVTTVLVLLAAGLLPGAAAAQSPGPRKIVIFSMPLIGWEEMEAGLAPNLASLVEKGSIGALSLRSVGPRTDLASALTTIGAGNRARAHGAQPVLEGDAVAAPNAGQEGAGARVAAMPYIEADNADLHFGAFPGELGQQLKLAGLRTGVAGNADGGYLRPTSKVRKGMGLERKRFGALALADRHGRVGAAHIGDDLDLTDPETLNGYRADPNALEAAAAEVIDECDVCLIELTDTYREYLIAYASLRHIETPEEAPPELFAAVRRDDAALGRILTHLDLGSDTVLVLGTSGPGPGHPERLSLAVMAGAGSRPHGWLTSATTLRDGFITVSDVGPGILRLLDLRIPKEMTGQPFRAVDGPAGGRVDFLIKLSEEALFHLEWVGFFFLVLVILQLFLGGIAWRRLQKGGNASPWLRRLTLGFMACPSATLVLAATNPARIGRAGPILLLVGVSAAITALSLIGPWRKFPAGPATFVCAVNLVALLADLAVGAPLQLSSLMGYSPIVAGRFYGLGNLAFAVLATSALLVAAQIGAHLGRRGVWLAAGLGILTIVADGFLGADFGGMLSLIPAFGVLVAQLMGRRVSFWRLLGLCAFAAAVAIVVGVLDSMRAPEVQTHVGRFVERLINAGPEAVQEVIIRKMRANWALLTQSSLSLSVPVALALMGILLARPEGRLRAALETQPGLKIGLVAALVANVLGFALNDSGVAVPALGLAIMAPFCLATVHGLPDRAGEEEPVVDAAPA